MFCCRDVQSHAQSFRKVAHEISGDAIVSCWTSTHIWMAADLLNNVVVKMARVA